MAVVSLAVTDMLRFEIVYKYKFIFAEMGADIARYSEL
jgi:hypothetical protein